MITEQRISIPLDALLDTRLGVLIYVDESQAIHALNNGYRQRDSDFWDRLGLSIDQQRYDEVYRQRAEGDYILRRSKITGVIPLIHQLSQQLSRQAQTTPFNEQTVYEINTYPYQLSEQVQNALLDGIYSMIAPDVKLQANRIPTEKLTPHVIRNDYSGIFFYNLDEWLQCHHQAIQQCPFPQVTVIAPAIYHCRPPSEDELYDEDGYYLPPFPSLEATLSAYMALSLTDIAYFSLIDV